MSARTHLSRLGLPCPGAAEILAATGATRSRAYELSAALTQQLPGLARPVGRPAAPARPAPVDDRRIKLCQCVLRFVMDHPGCVGGSESHRSYHDPFRRHILELARQHADMPLEHFASAVGVPLSTLQDWLRDRGRGGDDDQDDQDTGRDVGPQQAAEPTPRQLHIQTVLDAYRGWRGPFMAFCEHVRHHLRIDYGPAMIRTILCAHGERSAPKRAGRSPDELALRGAFETFFPGAQWVGDGTQLSATVNGQTFTFNLELNVDAHSAALVGMSVSDEEDGQAVVDAFQDAVGTTGSPPMALLLDNRPSNHTDEVDETLGEDTLRIRSTPGRAQNKAHVEGTFGLFNQVMPPIDIQARTARDLARAVLVLLVMTWARTLNHRPRRGRGGRSRVELHDECKPTEAQVAEAKAALEQRCRQQQKARDTRARRTDPLLLDALDHAFERLSLLDPERHLRLAIAGYGRDAAIDAIAIFEGRRNAGTLPDGVDARYMLGIARNLHDQHEADAITEALISERLRARDIMLDALGRERQRLLDEHTAIDAQLRALCLRVVQADRSVDRSFWVDALTQHIRDQGDHAQPQLFRDAARRVHATFALNNHERQRIVRVLARALWPVE